MLKNASKLLNFRSWEYIDFSLVLCNIRRDCIYSFSSYVGANKNNKDKIITEKNLTPIISDDSWDMSEIKNLGNVVHTLRLSKYHRRHDVGFYLRLIKSAADQGDTEKMLSVFLHDMLVRDRVMPDRKLVNILLLELANLGGHSEAAFRIVKRIKDIRLDPNMVTYSLLFKNCAREIAKHDLYYNICTNGVSLLSAEELEQLQFPAKRAFQMWKSLVNDGEGLNLSATNSLLLVLNRAGMLKESCMILDKFIEDKNEVDDYTLSAVLEGCLTDRKNGFGLALCFYNKLVNHSRCSISPFTITTLLKVVEKCQFGGPSLIQNVIDCSTAESQPFLAVYNSGSQCDELIPLSPPPIHCATSDYNSVIKETARSYDVQVDDFIESRWSPLSTLIYVLKSPTCMLQKRFFNIFDPRWLHSKLSPSEKLVCVGGIFGLLSIMKQYSVRPSIHTLTSIVKCLPYEKTVHSDFSSNDLFTAVLEKLAKELKIDKDQAFKNALSKRTVKLGLEEAGRSVSSSEFDPYGWSVQAKRCKNAEDVRRFFRLASESEVVMNKEMLCSLLTSVYTWGARLSVLHKMRQMRLVPDRGTLVHLEHEITKMRTKVKEVGDDEGGQIIKRMFYTFQAKYASWLDEMEMDSVDTGRRTILVDDLPSEFRPR